MLLTVLIVFNFYTHAHFGSKPKNVYDFELQMVEHSIGVGLSMKYLLSQPFILNDLDLKILIMHRNLVYKRAEQHDLSKFTHSPAFVAKYYPAGTKQQLSQVVYKYYGWDIRFNPKDLSQVDVAEAKNAFKTLNAIDDLLLDELVDRYCIENSIKPDTAVLLRKALAKLETIADLINRKMFENIYRFRRKITNPLQTREILEFGRPVDLHNADPYFWHNDLTTQKLAIRYFYSPTLNQLIANISPQAVVSRYRQNTYHSPFLDEKEILLQDQTIQKYVSGREALSEQELKTLFKKPKYRKINACLFFYGQ